MQYKQTSHRQVYTTQGRCRPVTFTQSLLEYVGLMQGADTYAEAIEVRAALTKGLREPQQCLSYLKDMHREHSFEAWNLVLVANSFLTFSCSTNWWKLCIITSMVNISLPCNLCLSYSVNASGRHIH